MEKEDIDKQILTMYGQMDWSLIPSHMWPGMKSYLENGIPPGSFLTSILTHDFYDAIFRADHMNQSSIVGWAQFLAWHLPMSCHGSPESVKWWMEKKGLRGLLTQADSEAA
jgi:hypothetical protein